MSGKKSGGASFLQVQQVRKGAFMPLPADVSSL